MDYVQYVTTVKYRTIRTNYKRFTQGRCHGVNCGGHVQPTFFPRVFLGLSRCGAYW